MTERDRKRAPTAVAFRRVERAGRPDVDSLYCPRRNRTMPVSECRQCEHWNGLCVDTADGEAFVRCAWLHDRAAPRAGAGAAAALTTIMSSPVPCVSPDDTLESVRALLLGHHVSAVPVVDESGRTIGIVTKTDVLHDVERNTQQTAEARVRQVMSDLVFALHCEADVSRAAALMAYEGVHHIIVCGADGRPAGIVSAIDILRWLARDHGYLMPERE